MQAFNSSISSQEAEEPPRRPGCAFNRPHSTAGGSLPVLAHIHIPKTAGTSLVYLLQQAGKSHINLYFNDTDFVYTLNKLETEVLVDPTIRSFSSHHVLSFPPYIAGRRILYFTLLRDPIQQFLSYLTFIKKSYKTIVDQNLLAYLPDDPTSLTLREFAHWLLTTACERAPFHENYTVNFIARQTYLHHNGGPDGVDQSRYRAARLPLAKAILDQFIFVGLVERIDESMDRLQKLLREFGIEIPQAEIGKENISCELRDDLSWVNRDDEVGALLYGSLEDDYGLYNWAVERFETCSWRQRVTGSAQAEQEFSALASISDR